MSNQTGPRPQEGKSASSQNNRQHGLSTANITVSPGERPFFDQMEQDLRNEVQPDGPLEPTEQNEANLQKVYRYYLRWEASYNSAFRQISLLKTDRGCIAHNNGKITEMFGPRPRISLRLN
ncbi:MAG: hypothetical protein IT168_28375 [Bryobacterales bacterium]|nr:hypothetical protein [Bryobacterales bacterium]